MATNLRRAWRLSLTHTWFSVPVVAVLGLGIGAAATMFALFDAVLLRPLPFLNPERLVVIDGATHPPDGTDVLAWWGRTNAFSGLALYSSGRVNATGRDAPLRVSAAMVSAGFFSLLGVDPETGRGFFPDEETPGHNRVAVLNHSFALNAFGSPEAAIDQSVRLDSIPHRVVGVMPPHFAFPGRTQIWVPRSVGGASSRMIGRLRAGATVTQAQSELREMLDRYNQEYARSSSLIGARPLQVAIAGDLRSSIAVLFGAVCLLLLIAWANTAGLLLSRAAAREREMAIRVCLGAGRARVAAYLLREGVMPALTGGLLGVTIALAGVRIVPALAPLEIPPTIEYGVDWRVLSFAFLLSLLTGAIVGLAPLLQTFKADLTGALRQDGSSAVVRRPLRRVLVVGELAVTLVLVAAAGLMLQSFRRLTEVDPGFDTHHVVTMKLALPDAEYPQARAGAFQRDLLDRVQRMGGVESSGISGTIPLADKSGYQSFHRPGDSRFGMAAEFSVVGDYFAAMGIPLLRGRSFDLSETEAAAAVVVISESVARAFWGSDDPIGDSFQFEGEELPREVIGVVGDVKHLGLDQFPEAKTAGRMTMVGQVYRTRIVHDMALVVRTRFDPSSLVPGLQQEVLSLDADVPLFDVRKMEEIVWRAGARPQLRAALVGSFALVALVLAAVGVYGVVSDLVSRRRQEVGVRMALGSEWQRIVRLFVGEGMRLVLVGVGMGCLAALGLNRLFAALLFGVAPSDPATLAASALLLGAVALVATAIPAFRAARVDPLESLRYE